MKTMISNTAAIPQIIMTWTENILPEKREIPVSVIKYAGKQTPHIERNPKKSLLKSLFAHELKLLLKSTESNELIYTFTSNVVDTLFVIKKDITTGEMVLFEDQYVLEANTYLCETLLSKLLSQ